MGAGITKTKDDEFEIKTMKNDLVITGDDVPVFQEFDGMKDSYNIHLITPYSEWSPKGGVPLCSGEDDCINGVTIEQDGTEYKIKVTRDIYQTPDWTSLVEQNRVIRSKTSGMIQLIHKGGTVMSGIPRTQVYFETLEINPGFNLLERNVKYFNNPVISNRINIGTYKNLFPETYEKYTFYIWDDKFYKWEKLDTSWSLSDELVPKKFVVFNPTTETRYVTFVGSIDYEFGFLDYELEAFKKMMEENTESDPIEVEKEAVPTKEFGPYELVYGKPGGRKVPEKNTYTFKPSETGRYVFESFSSYVDFAGIKQDLHIVMHITGKDVDRMTQLELYELDRTRTFYELELDLVADETYTIKIWTNDAGAGERDEEGVIWTYKVRVTGKGLWKQQGRERVPEDGSSNKIDLQSNEERLDYFNNLDTDGDGNVTQSEFLENFKELYGIENLLEPNETDCVTKYYLVTLDTKLFNSSSTLRTIKDYSTPKFLEENGKFDLFYLDDDRDAAMHIKEFLGEASTNVREAGWGVFIDKKNTQQLLKFGLLLLNDKEITRLDNSYIKFPIIKFNLCKDSVMIHIEQIKSQKCNHCLNVFKHNAVVSIMYNFSLQFIFLK